jgi:hypothetical protein
LRPSGSRRSCSTPWAAPRRQQKLAGWSGRADPAVAATFLAAPAELVELSDPEDVWAAVVDSEPQPPRLFRDHADLDGALAGFGDAADLKSPFFQGHSRGVALLVQAACGATSLDPVRLPGWISP